MVSLQTRISRLPFATLIGWTVCTVALLAQTAQPPVFPNAPQGFDAPRQGIATGRVERVEYISSVTGGKKPAMVYTPARVTPHRRSIRCSTCCTGSAATRRIGPDRVRPPPSSTT